MTIQDILSGTPANAFRTVEKRNGIYQLVAPLFHDDGDMMSIYLEQPDDKTVKISEPHASILSL